MAKHVEHEFAKLRPKPKSQFVHELRVTHYVQLLITEPQETQDTVASALACRP